jgi:D-alanyl-D-alanine carboxypeptidase (penicillin-binding protein 5/6)
MKKCRSLLAGLLVIIMIVSVGVMPASALSFEPDFEVKSEGVYLVNLDTDTVIYEKNANTPLCPASLTKIMTAIIALENCDDLEVKVTAPISVFNELYGKNASHAGISAGEEMRMIDLLYALILKSGCEAAGIIADYIGGGDTQKFVDMMNDKAKEIGAENTIFVDPHGLDNDTQRSTAYDMYLITKYALSIPKFKEIATTYYYELPPTNKRDESDQSRYWTHTNSMMNPNSKYYNPYVKGIKTGTSGLNTKNLISMAQKDGTTYLLVLLGAPYRDAQGNKMENTYLDSNNFYDWVFNDFSMRSVVDTSAYLAEVPVGISAGKNYVMAVPEEEVLRLLPNDIDLDANVQKVVTIDENVLAPVQKGDVVGSVDLKIQDEVIATVNLVASENVDRSTVKYIFYQLGRFFSNRYVQVAGIVLLILIILYIIFAINYNKKKKKNKNSLKWKGRRM